MPLGLLAKDSIQDLELLGREEEEAASRKADPAQIPPAELEPHHEELDDDPDEPDEPPEEDVPEPANPQQAQEEETTRAYEGFGSGYYQEYNAYHPDMAAGDDYAYHDPYSPTVLLGGKRERPNLLCCLFPFFCNSRIAAEAAFQDDEYSEHIREAQRAKGKEDDEMSSASDTLGEKLSDKERQAVMARLRLASPEAVDSEPKGLLNGIPTYDTSPLNETPPNDGTKPLKSILKTRSSNSVPNVPSSASVSETAKRRSLFPSYDKGSSGPKKNLKVSFAPMARVVSVKSRNDMTTDEKSDIWWLRSDYEDFRKTGRIITKAMLQGGSEIWLASNKSWQGPNKNKNATLKDAFSLSQKGANDSGDLMAQAGDKWWHKFGHSRRGLEHVVSIDEGRQRQQNVRTAIQTVLEEQHRQKMYVREDPEKLRIVSITHTSWARDLALASGASDADAVKTNFEENRKSREFYLLKMARNSPSAPTSRRMPEFMQPAMQRAAAPSQLSILDANTAAQIQYRRHAATTKPEESKAKKDDSHDEPVHDSSDDRRTSLSRRAAGFSADQDEKVNMAAVLSGMGAVTQEAHA